MGFKNENVFVEPTMSREAHMVIFIVNLEHCMVSTKYFIFIYLIILLTDDWFF
jgi:hypothetical protein